MGGFSFRLEKVLHYRAHLEKKVRLQVGEAVTHLKEQETLIRRLNSRRAGAARGLAEERSRGISVGRDRIHTAFLRRLTEELAEAHGELEKRRERLELLKSLWRLATMKKKSLESLKEEQLRRFVETAERMEQKLLDEYVVTRRERQNP